MHHLSLRREVPSLRRFGRAITAEQRGADVSVLELIDEMLAADASNVECKYRETIYREFLKILQKNIDACEIYCGARRSPLSWQCAWLKVVEGFANSEIATVVDKSVVEVENLLALHQSEAARQSPARLLIIEDEALIAYDLKRIVAQIGHAVVSVARTKRAAIEQYHKTLPELVLSDVQLADGETAGIEAVAEIGLHASVPVIFITAFPELLLKGVQGEPTYLIAKPFDPRIVQATIRQALFLAGGAVSSTPSMA